MTGATYVPQDPLTVTAVHLAMVEVLPLRFAVFLFEASELKVPLHVACPGLPINPVTRECDDYLLWFLPSLSLSVGNHSALPGFLTPNLPAPGFPSPSFTLD